MGTPEFKKRSAAQEMTLKWHGNGEKLSPAEFIKRYYDGYEGDGENRQKKWPNAVERQEKLVKITVNVAMKTLVWELSQQAKLPCDKKDDVWEQLGHLLTGEGVSALEETLQRRNGQVLDLRAAEDFLAHAPAAGYMRDADSLLHNPAEKMLAYERKLAMFVAERGEHTALLRYLGDQQAQGHATAPRKQTPPEDPHVVAFREKFGEDVIDFLDSGAKNRDTTMEKLMKRQGFLGIRDINRLTVIPRSPDLARVFETLLAKEMGDKLLIEGWEKTGHGHIDNKCYLALTDGCYSKKFPKGFLAEIRIEGPHMSRAYRNTHETYECLRILKSYQTSDDLIKCHQEMERNHELEFSPLIQLEVKLRAALHFLTDHKKGIGVDVETAFPELCEYTSKDKHLYEANAAELDSVREMIAQVNCLIYKHEMEQCTPEWKKLYEKVPSQSKQETSATRETVAR